MWMWKSLRRRIIRAAWAEPPESDLVGPLIWVTAQRIVELSFRGDDKAEKIAAVVDAYEVVFHFLCRYHSLMAGYTSAIFHRPTRGVGRSVASEFDWTDPEGADPREPPTGPMPSDSSPQPDAP